MRVTAALGGLSPDDVEVQLLHGPVTPSGELTEAAVSPMAVNGHGDGNGRFGFETSFACTQPGRYGWSVRVVPDHPDLIAFSEVGGITTA